jgi:hypothetical protein
MESQPMNTTCNLDIPIHINTKHPMKNKTPLTTYVTGSLCPAICLIVSTASSFAADAIYDNLTVNQTAAIQGATTLNGGLTIKSDSDAGHVNILKITSGGYGGLWWQPTTVNGLTMGRGVAFVNSAFRASDFGFFVAPLNHDGDRPAYNTGDARFYHDIIGNVTVIGHQGTTDPRAGHNATLNVEGSLAVDGSFSCGSFSGSLVANANTTITANQNQVFKVAGNGWGGQWWNTSGGKGVSLLTSSFALNDWGFFTAQSADVNPTWHVGRPRFYHDTDYNRTTIGHEDPMTKPAGIATLNVEGTLTATGVISGDGSGLYVEQQGDLSMGTFTSGHP